MSGRAWARNAGLTMAMLACTVLIARQNAAAYARARNANRMQVPSLEAPYPLPPLPERSARNANYTIAARLAPETHTIEGTLQLDWTNISTAAVQTFPFHLYWNAFESNRSTSARGEGRRAADPDQSVAGDDSFGFTHVRQVRLLADEEIDLTSTMRYIQPDDGNPDDRTVMEVRTPSAVEPGQHVRFRIDWTSRLPYGDIGRAGWVHDYNFVAQWFPKIGVIVDGRWNAHQFHPWSEFFSDYGVYDVSLTLPRGHIVGATGRLMARTSNADATETFRYLQEDVHDFAWTASRRFLERQGRFDERGYPAVEIRVLVQPEHASLADRYIDATRTCLRSYGAWTAPYPYSQITVVDPAWGSASGGMEYPTLITGGATLFASPRMQSPESVTIHECGHQFFYGLIGSNEFEEAWLDEGFNRYLDRKARFIAMGPEMVGRRYFGPRGPRGVRRGGIPVLSREAIYAFGEDLLPDLRRYGETDVMALPAWEYRTSDSYTLNSYAKPALSLATLEGLLGDETMTRILRTYGRRFRFAHPTSRDFIQVVNEVTGKDYQWFFDQTWYSSGLCDFAVTVINQPRPPFAGYIDGPDGTPTRASATGTESHEAPAWQSEVTLLRQGEVRLPVELLVEFTDGTKAVTETWDGQDRWKRFTYPSKVRRAVADPLGKIALDVRPSNNNWLYDPELSRREATKWAAPFLFWLQGLLELHLFLG